MRGNLVVIHRYVGLVLAGFLLVAGLTGALLVWYHELDAAVNASVMRVEAPAEGARPLDPLVLRERVQSAYPDAWVHYAPLHHPPGQAMRFWLEGPTDPVTGEHAELANDEIFVHPYTGEMLGARQWGAISQGWTNLLPFVYRLHYQLALGTVGTWTFGIIALLWTLDCFVATYLTFPARRRDKGMRSDEVERRGWLARWWPSWKLRWRGGAYKLNFDLHRAGGLWPWAMLFVLAWSSVGLNLNVVYKPMMGALFEFQRERDDLPKLEQDQPEPGISWREAVQIGERLMAREANTQNFQVIRAERIGYDPHSATFRYTVKSDRDIAEKWGGTSIWFDANTGERRAAHLPSGKAAGDTVTSWLYALHFAAVWGLPFRIFVTLMGLAVAMLSITGVYIWWRKYTAKQGKLVSSV